ncbi:hypothetical protein AGMMS4956_12230 [Bacteroidia bacterium]|nr:hypothetical protein AGMMS4956_12230 [Bacteroidia bacterium]
MGVLLSTAAAANAQATSGIEGGCSWALTGSGSDLTLTISEAISWSNPTAVMPDYNHNVAPWYYARTSITTLVINEGVTLIGENAFQGCSGLTSVTIPNSVTSIRSAAFSGCRELTSVTIPDGVTSIGWYAFNGCTGLTEVTIPNSVTTIVDGAFFSCSSLTSITIPNSVTSIGEKAFLFCFNLDTIKVDWDNPPTMNTNIFGDIPNPALSDRTLLIPKGTAAGVEPWSSFKQPFVEYLRSIANATVTIIGDTTYKNSTPEPALQVLYNTTPLTKNTHYTVEYSSSDVNAGTVVTVTLTGIGNYEGTKIKTFTIAKARSTFERPEALSTTYTPTLTLGSLLLPAGYAFVEGATSLSVADSGYFFAATYTNPNGNYTVAWGNIKVNIAKAAGIFAPLAAIDTTHAEGLTLGDIELPDNYVWQNPDSILIVGNNQNFAAIYTEPSGNYFAAVGQITVNVIPKNDATLQNLSSTVGTLAPTFDPNTTHYTLLLPCGDTSVNINAVAPLGGGYTVNGKSATEDVVAQHIGTTTVLVRSTAADGTTSKDYTVDVIRPFPASIIWQYWSSILAVNLNEQTNGGYTFTGFQWQQNGVDIDGATGAYLHLTTPPLATDSFGVALTIKGQTQALPACPQQFVPLQKVNTASIRAYPNPASNGQLTIDNVQWNAGDKIEIYNVNGTKVFETSLSIVHYPLSINIGHLPAGVYVVRVGEQSTIIVIK